MKYQLLYTREIQFLWEWTWSPDTNTNL